ncbi:MAG: tRNA (adenosine(37)-N6)-threonylcarbamoyltransferase complex ATPase subunit type 1 TsaE [Myxococcota bacterium]
MPPSEDRPARTLETRSEAETRAAGARLAKGLVPGMTVALVGDLGTGKTVFAKGLAAGLGCRQEASSPTFTLVNVYEGPVPMYHIDFYRLSRPEDVASLGFRDYLDGRGIVVVEWADRAPDSLPEARLEARFRRVNDTAREVVFEARGAEAAALLDLL